ncbi:MAG: hypothetical protein AAB384_03335 [Patescibacteria group bacterium]
MPIDPNHHIKYRPASSDNLTTGQLRFGEFWTRQRAFFRRVLIAVLLFIGVGGIGLGVYTLGDYLFRGQAQEQREVSRLFQATVPFSKYHESLAPQDPQFGVADVLPATGDLYDFVVRAVNPNTDWYATLTYTFEYNDTETAEASVTLLPNTEQIVAVLGQKSALRPGGAFLSVKNISWSHISPHTAKDPDAYVAARTAFAVSDIVYTGGTIGTTIEDQLASPTIIGVTSTVGAVTPIRSNRVTFSILNNTAYNYWSVPVYVLFMQNGALRSIERTEVKSLKSGESRAVEVRSLKDNLGATTVEILPIVNVFDDSAYMPQ